MRIETDINTIEKSAEQREKENWDFRCFLKGSDLSVERIDSVVNDLNRKVSAQIDCTEYGNCCKVAQPVLTDTDIEMLADTLKIDTGAFKLEFLTEGEDGLVFKARPSPFLVENKCTVYESRPKDCRLYPHLHKADFVFRVNQAFSNCSVCPIVFNVYEGLKQKLRPQKQSIRTKR